MRQDSSKRTRMMLCATVSSVVLIGAWSTVAPALAGTFSDFTPLASSVAAGSLPESAPLSLPSGFSQKSIAANDLGPQNGGVKLGDNWDMITSNENGPSAGRYLFTPYENFTPTAGVLRLDLQTGVAKTIVPEGTKGFAAGDASRWTPFGTYLTAEESWDSTSSTKGRLFEINNPLADPASISFLNKDVIPRVAHEGLAFDKQNNMYFVDEFNGGSIYKYTSTTPTDGSTFFTAGQTFVLKVGAGANSEVTGAATWVPITDANGNALAGITTKVIDGVTVIDGRAAADQVLGTGFGRPEDLEIKTLKDGSQRLFFAATTNSKVFAIDLTNATNADVKLFVSQATANKLTGLAVGTELLNTDNLAIDAEGNIYIIEDQPAGFSDVWFAYDKDGDGVAESIARWASLSTLGSEPTGLYFDPFQPHVAYINVQHSSSDVDRMMKIAVPEPGSLALLLPGLLGLAGLARRKRNA